MIGHDLIYLELGSLGKNLKNGDYQPRPGHKQWNLKKEDICKREGTHNLVRQVKQIAEANTDGEPHSQTTKDITEHK